MRPSTSIYFHLLLFSISIEIGKANTVEDSLLAVNYFKIADASYKDIPKCKRYSKLALPLLKKTKQWDKYISCFGFLSFCYEYEEAYDSMVINNNLAFEETIKYIPRNSSKYVFSLNNLGFMYSHVKQDYEKAVELYEEANKIAYSKDIILEKRDDISGIKGVIFKNLGDVYLTKGDYETAIKYLKHAVVQYKKIKDEGANFRIVESYKSLARAYQYSGDFQEAINFLQKLLQIIKNSKKEFPVKNYAYAYTQLAELNAIQENWSASVAWLKKVRNLRNISNYQRAEMNRLFSFCHLKQNQYKKAHNFLDKVFAIQLPEIPIRTSKYFQLRGEIFLAEGDYDSALNEFNTALTYLIPDAPENFNLLNLEFGFKILSYHDAVNILRNSAACYSGKNNQSNLNKALKIYKKISKLIPGIREQIQSENSKLFLSKNIHSVYAEAIETAFTLFEQTGEQVYFEQAFFFVEKSKAGVLLEEINAKEAVGISGIPIELTNEKYQLRSELNICRKRIKTEQNKAKPKEKLLKLLENRLFELTRKQEKLNENIKENHPEYSNLSKASIPALSKIINDLPDSESAIAEYFIGEPFSYALFISKEKKRFKRFKTSELKNTVTELLENLKINKKLSDFTKPAKELYDKIIGDFNISKIEELLIIPDGFLSNVPFDILLTELPESDNPKNFNYLIKSKALKYAYSLSLLELQRTQKSIKGRSLNIAPVFRHSKKKYLPNTEANIEALNGYKLTSHKYENATLDNFFQSAQNFNLINFSTHAIANDPDFEQPAIEFIDKKLLLSDLYTMNLPTHLVVLSACETGIGGERKGEGIMSLARGFSYAGVPSTVATLWKVNEKSTNTILQKFYLYLTKGFTKSRALQKAKIDYLESCDDIKSTPYYWAGMILTGNNQPVQFERKTPWLIITGGIILLLGLVFLYLKKTSEN